MSSGAARTRSPSTASSTKATRSYRARAGDGGGWVVTVTIFGGARPEAIAVCDLGAHVAFADPAVAEAAGVAFGKRWVDTHLLS